MNIVNLEGVIREDDEYDKNEIIILAMYYLFCVNEYECFF